MGAWWKTGRVLGLGAWLLTLAGLGWAQAGAQPAGPGAKAAVQASEEGEPQQWTLANGMTLLVKVDRRAPTAVHMLWLRVGDIDE